MSPSIEIFVVALALAGAPAAASVPADRPAPAVGGRLRVDFIMNRPGPRIPIRHEVSRAGILREVDSTSIRLEVPGEETLSITFGDIDRIAVSTGRSARQGMLRGGAYGAVIGLALGVMVNAVSFDRFDPGANDLTSLLAASAGGALLGVGLGSNRGGETWHPVPVRTLWEGPR